MVPFVVHFAPLENGKDRIMSVFIKFMTGREDRESSELGPFEYIQASYNEINASPDGETHLAVLDPDGTWRTPDGNWYSDFAIYTK